MVQGGSVLEGSVLSRSRGVFDRMNTVHMFRSCMIKQKCRDCVHEADSLPHTRTHVHTHTHAHALKLEYSRTRTREHTPVHTHAHTCSHMHTGVLRVLQLTFNSISCVLVLNGFASNLPHCTPASEPLMNQFSYRETMLHSHYSFHAQAALH